MWGNWIGWLISVVMAAGIAGGLKWVAMLDQPAATTSFVSDLSKFDIVITPSPRELVPADKPGDSAALLRKAIDAYLADPITYDRFNRGESSSSADKLDALAPLLELTSINDDGVFAADPSKIVTFDRPLSDVQAVLGVGKSLIQTGLLKRDEDPKLAEAHFRAAFSLGARLFNERLAWDEFNVGQTLLADSGAALARFYAKTGDAASAEKFKAFDAARRNAIQTLLPLHDVIASPNELAMHAGDTMFLAEAKIDRLWRVEAIFAAGRLQHRAARVGDATAAGRLVARLAESDPDPIIKRAATAARDMTDAQYQTSFQQVQVN